MAIGQGWSGIPDVGEQVMTDYESWIKSNWKPEVKKHWRAILHAALGAGLYVGLRSIGPWAPLGGVAVAAIAHEVGHFEDSRVSLGFALFELLSWMAGAAVAGVVGKLF